MAPSGTCTWSIEVAIGNRLVRPKAAERERINSWRLARTLHDFAELPVGSAAFTFHYGSFGN